MSVQFGRWNTDGKPVDPDYLEKVKSIIAPYGPDDGSSYTKDGVGILYRAFHTTKESRSESQPHVTDSSAVIVWDGRLDNRAELIRQLRDRLKFSPADDVSIVAAAYQVWGTDCFAKLIGDWAISIWDTKSRSLILAKDPIGIRHLYYSIEKEQITWSTILDPLVLFADRCFTLNEEYIAGWFSFFPAAHLTPYMRIHSVPPSSSVFIRPEKHAVRKYWDFDPGKKLRYRTDAEYEEHFRAVFGEAVSRRLRSDSPVLAELSGGMDSSSIVCMADTMIAGGSTDAPRLDTVSYYNDSEPNWNERPYFAKVEEKRGRTGTHIDVSSQGTFRFPFDVDHFAVTPSSGGGSGSEFGRLFAACLASQGNRVVLSGVGGDEVTGGVPTPNPELEDLLAEGKFRILAHQLKVWALNKRKPWLHLFFEAVRSFLPPALVGVPTLLRPPPWLRNDFVKRNRQALEGYQGRVKLFGPLPSFQENLSTLDALQRQLMCSVLSSDPPYEKRYPYLDRGLLEFLYAVPREQLVRPGQRRSLMRRALVAIVPDDLLNRKRKAFVVRAPMAAVSREWPRLMEITSAMVSASIGIVDPQRLVDTLEKVRHGNDASTIPLMRAFGVESWLQHLGSQKLLHVTVPSPKDDKLRRDPTAVVSDVKCTTEPG